MEKGELKALTATRGAAALAVVAVHFSATAQSLTSTVIPSLVPHGYVAVDYFFVLSGFIMCYTYLTSFEEGRRGAYADFLARRVARIMPLHVCVILAIAAAGLLSYALIGSYTFFGTQNFWVDLGANLLLLPGVGFGAHFNAPSWSISTEFAAYFAFPIFVAAVFSRYRPVWITTLVVAVVSLVWLASTQPRFALTVGDSPWNLIRCFGEFALGMAAFRLYRSSGSTRAVMASDAFAFGLIAMCALSLIARYDLPAVFLFPFVVASLALNKGLAARTLSWKPIYFLGVVSYSIYLVHNPLRPLALAAAQGLLGQQVSPVTTLLFAAAGTLAVIPVAWMTFTFIERPGRSVVRRLLAPSTRGSGLGGPTRTPVK